LLFAIFLTFFWIYYSVIFSFFISIISLSFVL